MRQVLTRFSQLAILHERGFVGPPKRTLAFASDGKVRMPSSTILPPLSRREISFQVHFLSPEILARLQSCKFNGHTCITPPKQGPVLSSPPPPLALGGGGGGCVLQVSLPQVWEKSLIQVT